MSIKDSKKVQKNTSEEISKLKDEIGILKKQADEFKNKYLRALADYQNYEKRVNEEKRELIKTANKELILKILPFLDHLEKAEIFVKNSDLKIIKDNFVKVLKEIGVEKMSLLRKEFDPYLAEAIDVIAGEKDNIIVEILRDGYQFHGKVIRIAQVKVSKKIIDEKVEKQVKEELLKGDYM